MPVSHIANALAAANAATTFSITLPTTQAGDIIILEYTHRATADVAPGGTYSGPAFALKHSQTYNTSNSGKTYWSRCTGDHAGETVTGTGLTNSVAAFINTYRGAKASGDPLAAATVVGEANASANETQAQITTTVAGAYVVLVVANSPDVAVTSPACTTPGALTIRAERLSTGGLDTSIMHASAERASAGATGAFTWAQTDGASGSWAYAIEPEPEPTRQPLMYTAAPLGAAAAVAMALLGVPEAIQQPHHDQLHEHRHVAVEEPGGHFLVDHVVVRQRDGRSDPALIDHAGRYFAVAGHAVEEEPPAVTGTSLLATQQFRQRDRAEEIRPSDHFRHAALYGRSFPSGHFLLPYAQYRVVDPVEELRAPEHSLHAYRSPALRAPQRLPYWIPLRPLEAELEELRAPEHDLHAHRSPAAEVEEPVTGTSLLAARQFRQRDAVEQIQAPRHDLHAYRSAAAEAEEPGGHFLVDHVQVRQRDRVEQIRPSDHFRYAALYGREQVAEEPAVNGHYVVGYTQYRILDPVEEIRPVNHDLLHSHRHERLWWEFLPVAERDDHDPVEEIRPDTRHAERLFPHRQIAAAAEGEEYLEYVTSVDYTVDHPAEVIRPDTRHAERFFQYRRTPAAAVAPPQRVMHWPQPSRLVFEQPPDPRPIDHAARFRLHRQFALAVVAPQRLPAWPQPSRLTFPSPDPTPIDHAARFRLHRQYAAPPAAPQRLPAWPQPSRLTFELDDPAPIDHAARLQALRQFAPAVAPQRLPWSSPLPTFEQDDPTPIDHAARFRMHRQFALPVLPPQRLPFWPQPSRLTFQFPDPTPIDHAARFLGHRQFAVPGGGGPNSEQTLDGSTWNSVQVLTVTLYNSEQTLEGAMSNTESTADG